MTGKVAFQPSLRLLLVLVLPLIFSAIAAFEPDYAAVVWALDLAIAALVILDRVWSRQPSVSVERELPMVFSRGQPNPVTLHVRSLRRRAVGLPIALADDRSLELESADLPAALTLAAGGSIFTYTVTPTKRGAFAFERIWVRYPSQLGLWFVRYSLEQPQAVRVYPDIQAVRRYDLLAAAQRSEALGRPVRQKGGEHEFDRLRDYSPDDEYRAIDWKATARRGKTTVREFQQERNQNILLVIDSSRLMGAESQGVSHVDLSLDASLMLAHVASRAGDQVGFVAFDHDVSRYIAPVSGERAVKRTLDAAFDVQATLTEANYQSVCSSLLLRQKKRALVILFTQVWDELQAQALLDNVRLLARAHLPVVCMFRDAEVERMTQQPDIYRQAAASEVLMQRERLVRRLQAGGAHVLHVMAESLTPSLVQHYLQVKALGRL